MKINFNMTFKNVEEAKVFEELISKDETTKKVIQEVAQSGFDKGVKFSTTVVIVETLICIGILEVLNRKRKGDK